MSKLKQIPDSAERRSMDEPCGWAVLCKEDKDHLYRIERKLSTRDTKHFVEQACAVEYERLAVLAVKHCPSSHRDFKEIEKLLIIISNKKQSSKDKFKEGE